LADPQTPYLRLTKPIVNDEAGEDLWGDKLNYNFDLIDTFASKQGALVEAPQDNLVYGRGTPEAWIETVRKTDFDTLATDVADNASDIAAITIVNNAQTAAINGKEPTIAPGTTAQFWRGDKTWQPYSSIVVDAYTKGESDARYEPIITSGNASYFWAGDKTWKPLPPAAVLEAPTDGQLYSRKGSTASWVVASAGAVVSDTAPTGMPVSTIWWNSSNGGLFIDYQDPNSRQWVMVNAAGMPEANKDGKSYARKDGAWFDLTATFAAKADLSYVNTQLGLKADKTYVDAQDALKLPLAGGTLTGVLYPSGSAGGVASATPAHGLEVRGAGGGGDAAYIALHRPGAFAVLFGLDTDNQLAYGGWSLGAGRRVLYDTNNFNPAAYAPVGGVGGTWTVGQNVQSNSAAVVIGTTGAGNCYLRPNGVGSAAGEFRVDNGGTAWVANEVRISGLLWAIGSGSNTTTNAANFYINPAGNCHRSTSSGYYKTQLEPLETALADKVLSLDPIFYRPGPETVDRQDWSRIGFLAEQAFSIDFRFATCEEENTPINVDLNAIVAALVSVVKRQGDRIAALEAALV